jgi:predicted DNA-binding protein YlxM (UPF0122 family)
MNKTEIRELLKRQQIMADRRLTQEANARFDEAKQAYISDDWYVQTITRIIDLKVAFNLAVGYTPNTPADFAHWYRDVPDFPVVDKPYRQMKDVIYDENRRARQQLLKFYANLEVLRRKLSAKDMTDKLIEAGLYTPAEVIEEIKHPTGTIDPDIASHVRALLSVNALAAPATEGES